MFVTLLLRVYRPTVRSTTRTFRTISKTSGWHASSIFWQPLHRSPRWSHITPRLRQRLDWQQTWAQGHSRQYRRQAFNYQRFQATQSWLRAWAARPTFYYEVGGIGVMCGGFYIYNLEPVPVSGRRRFNIVSAEIEAQMGRQMYQQTLQEYGNKLLPTYTKEYLMVQRVLNRLIPHSGLDSETWEVNVIDDNMKNAFVIPGGKVFVFRGILDVCQGEDGLAAVLGHEIAHNVAHHAAERMSQSFVAWPILVISQFLFGLDIGLSNMLLNLAFTLPGSRSQEEEADYIGLQMMAESCYDPSAAASLWSRMEQEERGAPPQFLSTHPSSHNRLGKINSWLPEAETKYENADCRTTRSFANEFKSMTNLPRW